MEVQGEEERKERGRWLGRVRDDMKYSGRKRGRKGEDGWAE